MPKRTSTTGAELFVVDNSDTDWKVLRYLRDWCQLSSSIDIATGYFEIGSLLALKDEWQKVDHLRILMGDEVSRRTANAFTEGLQRITKRLDDSLESAKLENDFLVGVPAIIEAIRSGKIACRVYRKNKFHAKAYITHARLEVVGSAALVGSSNFTYPGLTENVELNVQITGGPVTVLQDWFEQHWNDAEDVTPEILRTIERHTRDYSPFEVYLRSLHEFFRRYELTDREWLTNKSRVYAKLDQYQKDGFHELMAIADGFNGAFLCDSVGLGKTFIGMMLIEYLVERQRKRVALIVPKAARKPVWEASIRAYAPHLLGEFSTLRIVNHTDLLRQASPDRDYPALMGELKDSVDAIVIDEAHHFRNPGVKGKPGERPTHYRQLFDMAGGKTLFLLTATPINNRLLDLQHMIELFTQGQGDYFARLGIHSLPGHFRKMEKELEQLLSQQSGEPSDGGTVTNQIEAGQVLSDDTLFRALVVQRSRAYVRKSQEQQGGGKTVFPIREDPKVVPYSIKKSYGKLLDMVDAAFDREKPLFSLAIYYPLAFYNGPETKETKWEKGRQVEVSSLIRVQFLKRFESSIQAFQLSCETLLIKLLAWATKHSQTDAAKRRLERWKRQHADTIGYVHRDQHELFGEEFDEEENEDLIEPEMLEEVEELPRDLYRVDEILDETFLDLDQVVAFLDELKKFKPAHDDKLKALVRLLKTDPVLKKHKVIIFSEYMTTARYLKQQLELAGIDAVDEVDSASDRDRGEIICQFAPYYNGSSSATLKDNDLEETRVLISTDVLSEGLNLQDATRLINYDLHWNPVRLMQRIGRVDRRLNPDIEVRLLADHPDHADLRGTVAFWNFLPPEELDELLRLYARVAHKTLRISKTFGIEGKKLLTPKDEYDALKVFTHTYEGGTTPLEDMHLELQKLLKDYPDVAQRLPDMPRRIFSGKAHPSPGAKAVFFCYTMPGLAVAGQKGAEPAEWVEDTGETKWYLYDLATGKVADEPTQIVALVRAAPDTPRRCAIEQATLSDIRAKIEKHIKSTYLKYVQATVGVKPVLKAWMELN